MLTSKTYIIFQFIIAYYHAHKILWLGLSMAMAICTCPKLSKMYLSIFKNYFFKRTSFNALVALVMCMGARVFLRNLGGLSGDDPTEVYQSL